MTIEQRLERDLPAILGDLAASPYPDYIDDVLSTTGRRGQRSRWTFPERWLPMELVTERVPVTRMPWRQLGVLALVAALLATLLAVYIGSRTPKLPPPFGPAGNGAVGLERNGDLYLVDPKTSQETLLVGGPEQDHWVDFTPDGTTGVFTRWGNGNAASGFGRIGSIQLRNDARPILIQKDVIRGDEWFQISPSGHEVAFTADEFDHTTIFVAALDGSSFHQFGDVPITDYGGLSYLAPDGRELVYLARSANAHTHDIRALDLTTGETRAILQTSVGEDIFGNVTAAPDGQHLAYALSGPGGDITVHVIGVDGTGDSVVGHARGATFEAWPQWDPQGRRLLIERNAGDGVVHPVIIDLSGGPDVVIDTTISHNGAGKLWAPDGSSILAQRTADDGRQLQQETWDVRTGKVTPVTWPSVTPPVWQRTAS